MGEARASKFSSVQLFPQGEFKLREVDDRPVARVSWAVSAAPALPVVAGQDPLFAQLLLRHTAKVDYDIARTVAPATLEALRSALTGADLPLGAAHGVTFGGTVDAARLEPLRTLCWESARTELLTPRTVMESVQLTRLGPAEIAQHRDGISVNGWLPRMANSVGAFDCTSPPADGSTACEQMMGRFEGHSRTAMGFVWLSTPRRATQRRAPPAAPRCRPVAPTCACSSRRPSWACKSTP